MYAYQKLQEDAAKLLSKHVKSGVSFEIPPENVDADLAFPCFMLAKEFRKRPQDIAIELAEKIKIPHANLVGSLEALGPYLNIRAKRGRLYELIVKDIESMKAKYGQIDVGAGKRTLVEFPSVNPGKPWHIGHARNAALGDAIQRLFRFSGYDVLTLDYIDDLGLQVAQILWGLDHIKTTPKRDGRLRKEDQWQGHLYVHVAKMLAENKKTEEEIRELMEKMESGEPKIKKKLEKVVDKCLKAQYETAFRMGIYHDLKIHESDLIHSGLYDSAIETLKKNKHIVLENDGANKGCLVAKLGGFKEFAGMKDPDKILIRSNGVATYTGKDMAFQLWKFGLVNDLMKYSKWMTQPNRKDIVSSDMGGRANKRISGADMVINVIGVEQAYPQMVLRKVLELMGYTKEAENSIHLGYEHVWFKEAGEGLKFSGRKGTWFGYSTDEVLDKAVDEAFKAVSEKRPDKPVMWRRKVAEIVGVGAVKYILVKNATDKKVMFDWAEALDFNGNSAPYLQYTHARAMSILRKAGRQKGAFDGGEYKTKQELALLSALSRFPDVVFEAQRNFAPSEIATYLFDLAQRFNSFYTSTPVIKATEKERVARLKLVKATARVIANGLSLLGILAPEEM